MPVISDHRHLVEDEDVTVIPSVGAIDDRVTAVERALGGPGQDYFVAALASGGGDDGASGLDWEHPLATMAAAFALVGDHGRIFVIGNVREQLLAPLGIQGVRIIGAAGGRTRHDDGARWYAPASVVADTPLLTLREQGWEVHNLLFVPPTDLPAIRFRRAEDATYPDGSHAIVRNCKFVGDSGTGIEDHGGCHHWLVEDCEFAGSATALPNGIKCVAGAGIAAPLRVTIRRCTFTAVTNAIQLPGTQCVVERNKFGAGTIIVTTHGGSGGNFVIDNQLPLAQANVNIAGGVRTHASDIVRNLSTDTAAATVGAVTS
jgi:hypothetical protein